MTLLDQISEALGATDALGALSGTIGASADETNSLVSAGLPAILGALGAQASGDGNEGIGALMGLFGDDKGNFTDSIGSFFGAGDKTGLASKLVGSLFGSQRSGIESLIAGSSGGTMSMVSRVLPMLAPAVMGLLGKITADDGLDAEAMTEQLGALSADGPLSDLLAAGTDDDRAEFVQGIGALREAGGLGALVPAAAATTAAAAPVAVAAAASAAQHLTMQDGDADRNGLGWMPAIVLPLIALIAGLVLWQCGSSNDGAVAVEVADEVVEAAEPVTIADLAVGSDDLSTLVDIVSDLGLVGTLADPDAGPFTVFAPTNDAFAAAGPVLAELDGDQTTTAVTYHVVPGVYSAADLADGASLETLAGETLVIGPGVTLPGGVNVIAADLEADNGIVHVVDGVLVPDSIAQALAAPEPTPEPEPTATPEPTAVPVVTIADLALGSPDLSTLVDVATQLDLVGLLADPDAGPFTVFAPTNDAFSSADAVLARLSPGQTETAVTFHVVPGVFKAADLTPGTELETVAGETLVVGADGTLTGGVNVITADLEADNGVVHIVENLLVPGSIQRSLASEDVNELFALEPIQFALGSADILPESVPTLDQAIATLTTLPEGTVFEVQGHTDSQGGDAPNQELSEARAASVVAYLTSGGVDADMLVPRGYGESQLKIDPEVTPEDFAANRRIEFLDISG